jgi:hypothetical protein
MEATSALAKLPNKVIKPAAAQQAMTSPGEPRDRDIPEIFLNTPDPIIELMTNRATPHIVMDRSNPGPEVLEIAIASI